MQVRGHRLGSAALPSPAPWPRAPPPVWRSFYKGSVDCFKQGYAWFFMGYEATVNYFLQNAGPGVHTKADLNYMQVMGAGVMAGFGLWGSMFPIDTIKSKLQADNLAKPQYSSTMDCVRKVLASEGQAGLWRGFSAAMYRAIPVNAGIFLAVEGARQASSTMRRTWEHIYGAEWWAPSKRRRACF
ncbi:hypothetical protein HYH02_015551 [Chlamydomonas schloesseri]|uniref:Mitochondrial carrier protein n=1 Tax=Chlamydomonas schloesseri TaxID=2026947 RepID=A0A835VQD1_9CHLO|nr:hypothetical protein HYH02_015551 [Chlamydomonas schloesseri]|eukprot:KAG2421993.1 hypothetical protein HYH02_015551 [Chlamydomonas schloesseri]